MKSFILGSVVILFASFAMACGCGKKCDHSKGKSCGEHKACSAKKEGKACAKHKDKKCGCSKKDKEHSHKH